MMTSVKPIATLFSLLFFLMTATLNPLMAQRSASVLPTRPPVQPCLIPGPTNLGLDTLTTNAIGFEWTNPLGSGTINYVYNLKVNGNSIASGSTTSTFVSILANIPACSYVQFIVGSNTFACQTKMGFLMDCNNYPIGCEPNAPININGQNVTLGFQSIAPSKAPSTGGLATVEPVMGYAQLLASNCKYVAQPSKLQVGFPTDKKAAYAATDATPTLNEFYNYCMQYGFVYAVRSPTLCTSLTDGSDNRTYEKERLDINTNLPITISPNPTYSTIDITHPFLTENIILYNLNGQVVTQLQPKNTTQTRIDLSHLPQGMYLLEIDGKDMKKIVKY